MRIDLSETPSMTNYNTSGTHRNLQRAYKLYSYIDSIQTALIRENSVKLLDEYVHTQEYR